MIKYILLVFIISIISKSFGGNCFYDWQCPSLPNSYCRNKISVHSKDIAVHGQRVYFTGRYTGDSDDTAPAYLFSVPFQPNQNDKYREEFKFEEEIFTILSERFGGIMGYEFNDKFFVGIKNRFKNIPYLGFYSAPFNGNGVDVHSYTPLMEAGTYQKMYFDVPNNKIYHCKLDQLVGYTISETLQLLLSFQTNYYVYCEGLWKNGDNLYWTSRDKNAGNFSINFHIGNIHLTGKPNMPSIIGENEEIYAFTGSNTDIIYSTKTSLYKMAIPNGINNGKITRQLIVNDPSIESAVYKDGFVYYSTSNSYIKKVNLQNNQVTVLYEPNDYVSPKQGNCTCRYGFTGNNCDTCPPGNQIIWDNGIPTCRPYGYCIQDYQCNNIVPSFNFQSYSYCYLYNQCNCKISYLTYPNCDKCPNGQHMVWENNIPQCKSN
ncbi:EGF-like domain-containing protein [Tieghemostelium lacteum]|uniref:EGF-like domain-containing protein n=1 Tax=Tieghemostelium lacteum TaxID=361077 RepID=A0A152A7K5_TIELA|nr:EGF-like domain-containing protein [Tieghemostelium lacteum]|eukprot:KYR02184.1 EGF-like domain-containing protein [Tieghemostelium lacteum]